MLTLQGVRRLIRFDQVGFLFFDASRRGFWRSFGAALICLPIWGSTVYERIAPLQSEEAIRFLLIQSTAYVIAWLAYPLLVLKVADLFGVWANYYRYMVAYNWFQPVWQLMWAPLLILDALQEGDQVNGLTRLLYLLIQISQGAYGWFMARYGLGLNGWNALALTLIDILLGLLIDLVTLHL